MRRETHTVRAALLGLAVAGALGFGTTQAFARPAKDAACTIPSAAGSCNTTRQCRDICAAQGSNPTFSECRDRCCFCDIQ
ncbi:MAG TPA: hypothetical protein VGX50_11815 [Longimicrobium sp.]|jgi:hypothetical protein|nr:hypothetical protein [Longimicrobium sp.]